ncbi:MAG: hypothetical protein ABIS20_21860 [Thermoanaerobaculia bacterium]
MTGGLLLAWLLLSWGAQAAVPWRLAAVDPERRRPWVPALLPLLVTGALAAVALVQLQPDAALAQGLYPLGASGLGRGLAVLLPALALADILIAIGWRRMEAAGWKIAAGFGLAFLLAATWAAELMRTGEGPASAPLAFIALVLLRMLLALGTAEALTPGRPLLAAAAGLALPLYALLLPAPLAHALGAHGQWLTLAAASLLLLGARWLPPTLRRPALLGGTLLAGLYLGQATHLSQGLGQSPFPPMVSPPPNQ